MKFFRELKRRNVFKVGAAYVVVAWVLLQGIDFVLDVISVPDWVIQVFVLAAIAGLPIVTLFSWVFEFTPEGIKRESEIDHSRQVAHGAGRKLDRTIIIFLVLAIGLLLVDRNRGTGELIKTEGKNATGQQAAIKKPAAPHDRNLSATIPDADRGAGQTWWRQFIAGNRLVQAGA